MREVVKSIADRLCDEGLLECLSTMKKITTGRTQEQVQGYAVLAPQLPLGW